MKTEIIMPKAGMDMQEGRIIKWLKDVGDRIEKGEVILEIMTDKVGMEIEAEESGYLIEKVHQEGDTVPVITVIGYIGDEQELEKSVEADTGSKNVFEKDDKDGKENEKTSIKTDGSGEREKPAMEVTGSQKNGKTLNGDIEKTEAENIQSVIEDTEKIKDELEDLYSLIMGENIGTDDLLEKTGRNAKVDKSDSDNRKNRFRATPASRKLMREENIDPMDIYGSGPEGRIQKSDVLDYIENHMADFRNISPLAMKIAKDKGIDINKIKGSGHNGKVMKADVEDYLKKKAEDKDKNRCFRQEVYDVRDIKEDRVEKMSPMRKAVARKMSSSFYTAPSFTINMDVDMTNSLEAIDSLKDDVMAATGEKLSITEFITFMTSRTLMKHPIVNSTIIEEKEELLYHGNVNMAVAVEVDDGIITPVIKNSDILSLSQLVKESKRLVNNSRNHALMPEDLENSTFTISNLGMFGVKSFNPIVNTPNAAILGVCSIIDTPVAVNGNVEIRPVMTLCLTVDHRVVDGAVGARFLKELKDNLENPYRMFL